MLCTLYQGLQSAGVSMNPLNHLYRIFLLEGGGDSNVWYMYMCIHVVGQNRGQAPQETRPLRLLLTPHTQLAKTKFTVHHTL